ncbi:MAG: EI24 domain-containing protein [Bacteroidota bacterium]
MKYVQHLTIALRAYIQAFKIIFGTQIWLAFSIPLLLSAGLYFGGDVLADNLKKFQFSDINEDSGAQYLLIGVQSLAVYISKYMTRYVVIALLAPLLTAISTRVEFVLTGNSYPFSIRHYIEDVVRALTIATRNIILQILAMGVLYGITYVYGLPTMINDIGYYLLAFYFYGFSFLDYTNERRRLSVSESVRFTRKHFVSAFTLGAVYGLLWYIPFAGVVVAPILAVVAGTIVLHELVDLTTNPYAIRQGETEAELDRDGGDEAIEVEVETD